MYNARAGVAALAVVVVAASAASASAETPHSQPRATAASAAAVDKATPSWHRIKSSWPKHRAVTVTDVTSIGKHAWVAANSGTGAKAIPIVQSCTTRSCKATRLARPNGHPSWVTSISADGAGGLWAAGYRVRANGMQRPVWWRYQGGQWHIFGVDISVAPTESLRITDLESANASKAYAVGRYDYGNGVTNTFYRWNGGSWKELAPSHSTDFPPICAGWFHRHWTVMAVRNGDAVIAGTCGPTKKRVILEDGPTSWIRAGGKNPPTGASWTNGSFIGQQLWLVGAKGRSRQLSARDGNRWSSVSSHGIAKTGRVTAIDGANSNKVWLVGWIPTGHHHFAATSWRFGGGSWHQTDVPAGVSRSRLIAVSMDSGVANSPAFAVGNDLAASPADRAIIVRATG